MRRSGAPGLSWVTAIRVVIPPVAVGLGCRPSVTDDIRTRTPVLRYYYGEPLTEDPTPALLRACPGAGSQTARRRPRGSRLI